MASQPRHEEVDWTVLDLIRNEIKAVHNNKCGCVAACRNINIYLQARELWLDMADDETLEFRYLMPLHENCDGRWNK